MSDAITKAAHESADMDRAIARVVCAAGERYTVFGFDRRAVNYANDLVTARALAAHHHGYVKDSNGRIYAARLV